MARASATEFCNGGNLWISPFGCLLFTKAARTRRVGNVVDKKVDPLTVAKRNRQERVLVVFEQIVSLPLAAHAALKHTG